MQGPAPCPVIACGKTLRKNKFRKQTFEDVAVEREVDVRKRVALTFNKRQDDFDSLREYNDYLEEVEQITFNLVNKIDVKETEAKLLEYEAVNRELISTNAARQAAEMMAFAQATEAEKESQKLAREMAVREREEERREQEELKIATLNALASGDKGAVKVIQEVQLKRSGERKRRQADEQMKLKSLAEGRSLLKSSLLAGTRKKVLEDGPFDPLGGLNDVNEHYIVQDYYENKYVPFPPQVANCTISKSLQMAGERPKRYGGAGWWLLRRGVLRTLVVRGLFWPHFLRRRGGCTDRGGEESYNIYRLDD